MKNLNEIKEAFSTSCITWRYFGIIYGCLATSAFVVCGPTLGGFLTAVLISFVIYTAGTVAIHYYLKKKIEKIFGEDLAENNDRSVD